MAHRIAKLNSVLQKEIAHYIARSVETKGVLVTLTYVALHNDLRFAEVGFVCVPDTPSKNKMTTQLNSHSFQIQKIVASRYNLKYIPKIKFIYDENDIHIQRIDEIMGQI